MRVKRYVAETLQDAMLKVKIDMGKDAVILHTRKFKEGGFFGFFGKQMFEVTAAIEDSLAVNAKPKSPNPQTVSKPQQSPNFQQLPNSQQLATVQSQAKSAANPAVSSQQDSVENSSGGLEPLVAAAREPDLHEEIQEMKSMLNDMMMQMDAEDDIKNLPKCFQRYHQILTENDVEDKLAKKIVRDVAKQIPKEESSNQDTIRASFEQYVLKLLKKPKPISFKRNGLNQQSIALVGPTGVGKTTTIAKLAATFAIVDKKNVALITADTYRVAAVEQLKTYGEIIGIPVDVVFSPQELQEAINRHLDKDLILIDTAGRSHKNAEQMIELKSFLDVAEPSEIFLVLSASTKCKDMMEIVNRYSDIPINKLIFTKLDETSSYGAILNVISRTQKQLSYITVGQNVPDDIEIADPAKMVNMIVGER